MLVKCRKFSMSYIIFFIVEAGYCKNFYMICVDIRQNDKKLERKYASH